MFARLKRALLMVWAVLSALAVIAGVTFYGGKTRGRCVRSLNDTTEFRLLQVCSSQTCGKMLFGLNRNIATRQIQQPVLRKQKLGGLQEE